MWISALMWEFERVALVETRSILTCKDMGHPRIAAPLRFYAGKRRRLPRMQRSPWGASACTVRPEPCLTQIPSQPFWLNRLKPSVLFPWAGPRRLPADRLINITPATAVWRSFLSLASPGGRQYEKVRLSRQGDMHTLFRNGSHTQIVGQKNPPKPRTGQGMLSLHLLNLRYCIPRKISRKKLNRRGSRTCLKYGQ